MLTFIALLIVVLVVAATIWGFRSPSSHAESLRRQLPTLYGAVGGLLSLLLPWISFALLDGLASPPLLDALSAALEILAGLLDLTPLGIVAWLLERMTWLPGYMLFVPAPSFHPLVLSAVATPALAGLVSLAVGLIAFVAPGRRSARIGGGLQLAVSIASLLLLLAAMPVLDQWGTSGAFRAGVLAVSLGAGVDFGAWVAALSLVLMASGALIALLEPAPSPHSAIDYGYRRRRLDRRSAPPWRR